MACSLTSTPSFRWMSHTSRSSEAASCIHFGMSASGVASATPPLARTASRIMKSPTAAGTRMPLAAVTAAKFDPFGQRVAPASHGETMHLLAHDLVGAGDPGNSYLPSSVLASYYTAETIIQNKYARPPWTKATENKFKGEYRQVLSGKNAPYGLTPANSYSPFYYAPAAIVLKLSPGNGVFGRGRPPVVVSRGAGRGLSAVCPPGERRSTARASASASPTPSGRRPIRRAGPDRRFFATSRRCQPRPQPRLPRPPAAAARAHAWRVRGIANVGPGAGRRGQLEGSYRR